MYASETAYNKGNNRGAKVGNWVEENALEKRTGNHRGFVGPAKGTFDRVVAHDQDQDYKTLAASVQTNPVPCHSPPSLSLLTTLSTAGQLPVI